MCAFIHHCPRTRIMDILRRGFWLFWCMLLTFLIKPTILCSLPHRDPNVVAWLLGGTFLPAKYGALGHFARICNLAKLISSPSPFCQKKVHERNRAIKSNTLTTTMNWMAKHEPNWFRQVPNTAVEAWTNEPSSAAKAQGSQTT